MKKTAKKVMNKSTKSPTTPKGKKVKGINYPPYDEIFDRNVKKKQKEGMETPGIAVELKLSQAKQGYSKQPRVEPQKKTAKPVSGQKNIK